MHYCALCRVCHVGCENTHMTSYSRNYRDRDRETESIKVYIHMYIYRICMFYCTTSDSDVLHLHVSYTLVRAFVGCGMQGVRIIQD